MPMQRHANSRPVLKTLACAVLTGAALAAAPAAPGPSTAPGATAPTANAEPASHVLDGNRLAALHARVRDGALPGVHAVIIQQHGNTIAEWYRTGTDEAFGDRGPRPLGAVTFGPETLHDVRSVTKSVVSLLFGTAVGEGAISDIDAPALDWFPEYAALRTPERLRIRVRDLLSMTSGWHWDEWSRPYTDPRNSEIAMDIAADPHRYVFEQAIDAGPGTRWSYSGGDVAIVGAIVARATKMPLEEFARTRLFEPMDIRFEWSRNWSTGSGIARAASGLRLSARDMAKLGQLVLQRGRWEGRQLVPAEWIERATAGQVPIAGSDTPGNAYGYLWWLGEQADGTAWTAAIGNGGQRIWLVPRHALVIVVTAGNYNEATQGEAPREILDAVLAATTQAAAGAPPPPP